MLFSFQAAENIMDKQKQLIMYFRMTNEEDRKEVYIYLFIYVTESASNVIKVCQCSSGGSRLVNTLVTNQSISHE